MTRPPAIELDHAGKRYTKYEDTPMLITRAIKLRSRSRRSKLWALRGTSFTVATGECIGVIGRNGSGKSTLLQMLAGVTAPTEGRVVVRGRVAPLISVGVGFHPELTGRENVYVNATILGLSRREVDERFDEIVEFSEISDFIDTPVKFYSSGMFVRLGFSVSVLAEPDVLLIDEVLAVGDMAFQMKCFTRMEHLRESGATIVMVTHNLNAVRRMCDRTLVIHDGQLRHDGDTIEALSLYHELLGAPGDPDDTRAGHGTEFRHLADFEDVELVDSKGNPTRHVGSSDPVAAQATIRFREPVRQPILGLVVSNGAGINVYGEHWRLDGEACGSGRSLKVRIDLTPTVATGSYSLHLGLASDEHARTAPVPQPILFFVTGRRQVRGVADLQAELTVEGSGLG